MSVENALKMIEDSGAKFVDLRFTDTRGKEQHLSMATSQFGEAAFESGIMFDGSSIAGWRPINKSDMALLPDPETVVLDPFSQEPTMLIRCDVLEPVSGKLYDKCPRSIGKKAEEYLRSTGFADTAYFGPEAEFFVFDGVRWSNEMHGSFYEILSNEGAWSSSMDFDEGPNMGHRPGVKGGYFPVSPVDSLQDLRTAMSQTMTDMGVTVEKHHHEVGTAGQCEIGIKYGTLVRQGDAVQTYKYCVHNVAHIHGMTATFMPKPLVGDNGSGMHVHQSLSLDGSTIFSGDGYCGLSETALHYVAGIFKHARAINAFTNPTTNSYKRLVPGFEAPVLLAYSARNRSASCRIPFSPVYSTRIEVRFPDPSANPYLAFAAMLMAGLDGIKNKLDPGNPHDEDLYELTPEEEAQIPHVSSSLDQSLAALDSDRDFLKEGDVFSDDMITSYIELRQEEVDRLRLASHPVEFEMYYSV